MVLILMVVLSISQGQENQDGNVRAFTFEGNDWLARKHYLWRHTRKTWVFSIY